MPLPRITAISYTWGVSGCTDRLLVQDNGYIPPSESAAYILLRAPRGRWLWIDPVCINQQDKDEKAQWVLLMWQIHSNASLVMVWLGDLAGDADLALAFLRQWCIGASYGLAQQDDTYFSDSSI